MTGYSTAATLLKIGDWTVEPAANRMFRGDKEVRVEPKAMRVLTYLVERRGEVVSRHDLETQVWSGMIVTDDAVTNTVIKLRRALGDNARSPRYIETIAKTGYRLIAETSAVEAAAEPAPDASVSVPGRRLDRHWRKTLIASLGLLLGGSILWWATVPLGTPPADEPVGGVPVIAVLPFESLSADPGQDYFANGITEDLITDLSKLGGLRVVARNSAFAYRGDAESEGEIGRQLHARYILRGSVQRAGERLRINIRLTDTEDGSNRWAERYDRKIADIFLLQDEITHHVVSALQVELSADDRERLVRDYATNIEAYDLFLRGMDLYGRRTGEANELAQGFFERAIAIEPGFARAYAALALTHATAVVNSWGASLDESLAQAETLTRKAMQLDDSLPQVHFAAAIVGMYRGNYAAAMEELARAIELKPSYADAHASLGWVLHFAGRPREGLTALAHAIDLNPRVPATYQLVEGALHYALEDTAEAIRVLELAIANNPSYQLVRVYLAAAYAAAGDLNEAGWQVAEVLTLNPNFSLADVERAAPIRDPAYKERFLRDLQRAGLTY
ncbi:MAG: winged helix-turn-helix domain-containing tetratricopeptide repeat protein [Chromatiaceae bacterium]|jgi:TolB-like protein/DNA-binding winged helix-turn-helix (wHTH) protein